MIFRQLFEEESSTYTYLLGCSESKKAVLIDPVLETVERDVSVIKELGLKLHLTLETHVHADHITGAGKLRGVAGCRVGYPKEANVDCADFSFSDGEQIIIGEITITPIFTPGHTDNHYALLLENTTPNFVFSGDSLLINGCGRTDFQSGDAATLYKSIHERLFQLPFETLVYPAHDYKGHFVSSVIQEKTTNVRLHDGISEKEFIEIMNNLNLSYPKKIDAAVPGNQKCGL